MQIPNTLLFTVEFDDGHRIVQTDEDKSELEEGKNAFYDVMEYMKKHKPTALALRSSPTIDKEYWFAVDFITGHFEVGSDGHTPVPFFQHRSDRELLSDFRLIYLRNVKVLMAFGESEEPEAITGYELGYTIGWQTNDQEGRNIQRILKV